jgi:hypothetical protein
MPEFVEVDIYLRFSISQRAEIKKYFMPLSSKFVQKLSIKMIQNNQKGLKFNGLNHTVARF